MATMKDVARRAGVSTSTVSHVLNQTRFVSDSIVERVKIATQELHYSPSALARSLKINSTQTLGMLLTTSCNPFFAEVLKGVERRCYERGYHLILCNTEGDLKRMQANIQMLLQRRVDGLLLMCGELDTPSLEPFNGGQLAVPSVVMDWGPEAQYSDKIRDNSLQGGYLATHHLITQGFTQIGCLTGPLNRHTASRRLAGFHQAMQHAQLPVNSQWIASGSFDCKGGEQAFMTLHSRGMLPDALFVCNDMMAMGVLHRCAELGIRVPEQLSIIGYDDIELAQYLVPALTTIHQPKYRMGQQAVDRLIERIQHPDMPATMIELEPTLVQRDSIKPKVMAFDKT
ncbi:substrate-binding domain-containing protein [Celerinatantimonas yamalensis]|uniref:Ribose operon repressor n=1 Tax=Celerinatantimonas yamalensis TaxID=559956 RepID=A0ABW9G1W1_9GAMM